MADDDDNNTGAALPTEAEEEENSVGDIEQGRSSSSWVAVAVSGRTSTADPSTTTTTTWPQGGLEHVDVEEATPVLPLIQQIADMEIEKGNTNANIHANVAPSEDASMTRIQQPPKQGAMEATVAADILEARLNDKLFPGSGGHTKEGAAASVNAEVARANHDMERKSKLMGRKAFAAVDILEARLNDKLLTSSGGHRKEGETASAAAASVNAEVARVNHDKERKSKLMGRKAFAAVDILEARLNDKLLTGSLNTNTNINADMASEDASTTPQPPKQGAMEQIEDGDDAAPRPLNSAEFEDESKAKLDLVEELADEDDGPPLPFQQRDSLSDAKKMAATSQISSSEAASSIDRDESVGGDSSVGDEENILQRQRVVGPENRSASDNEGARQVVSTAAAAAERNPSVPILEAYLVEEGPQTAVATPPPSVPVVTPGGHDTVYEATPVEPELPWWKQRRTKVFMVIICVLILIIALIAFLRPPAASPIEDELTPNTTNSTIGPIGMSGASSSSSPVSLTPTRSPTAAPSYRCFADSKELKNAVNQYVNGGCGAVATLCPGVSDTYGWPIGSWCIGEVTGMSRLFEGLDTFDEDISGWNVGRVTDMSYMFKGATSFNQNLSNWDTSAVTNMTSMFDRALAFDGNISSWNTAAVVTMYAMFWGASSFNQNLSNWDTSAVTTMYDMFSQASSFNPEDLSKWDTSAVTNMYAMFWGASAFNGNISSWDTSAVTDMSSMFREASSFNPEDLSKWDTSAVTNMYAMFRQASSFDCNISSWNTSSVTTMKHMFLEASAFKGNVSSWDTSAVTDMNLMFRGASSFNQDLCAWKDKFPYSNADDIFVGSGCTFQGSPQIEQQGPFCASNCTSG